MTHPEFATLAEEQELIDPMTNIDDMPEEFGGCPLEGMEPPKTTELDSDQISNLRMAVQYYAGFEPAKMRELLGLLEFGCGVTVRNCNAQTDKLLEELGIEV